MEPTVGNLLSALTEQVESVAREPGKEGSPRAFTFGDVTFDLKFALTGDAGQVELGGSATPAGPISSLRVELHPRANVRVIAPETEPRVEVSSDPEELPMAEALGQEMKLYPEEQGELQEEPESAEFQDQPLFGSVNRLGYIPHSRLKSLWNLFELKEEADKISDADRRKVYRALGDAVGLSWKVGPVEITPSNAPEGEGESGPSGASL